MAQSFEGTEQLSQYREPKKAVVAVLPAEVMVTRYVALDLTSDQLFEDWIAGGAEGESIEEFAERMHGLAVPMAIELASRKQRQIEQSEREETEAYWYAVMVEAHAAETPEQRTKREADEAKREQRRMIEASSHHSGMYIQPMYPQQYAGLYSPSPWGSQGW